MFAEMLLLPSVSGTEFVRFCDVFRICTDFFEMVVDF